MNSGYTPAESNIVPPLRPGTRLAIPISKPPKTARANKKTAGSGEGVVLLDGSIGCGVYQEPNLLG